MSLIDLDKNPLGSDWEIEPDQIGGVSISIGTSWARQMVPSHVGEQRLLEWYFESALLGYDTLNGVVEINSRRRGGVPVLRGTRFTVSQTLAELANSSGVAEVSSNYELDPDLVVELLNGLSLIFMRPIGK